MRRSPPGSCCGFLYSAKFKFRSRGENSPANYPEIRTLVSRSLGARDRIPRARRDGSAAAARWPAGLREPRRGARRPRSHIASRWERSGRHVAAWARSLAGSTAIRIAPPASFLFPCPGALCGQPQGACHFAYQFREGHIANAFPRIKHHVYGAIAGLDREPYRFAHPPLDAVALDCSSQHLAHGESYTGRVARPSRLRAATTPQKEHRHVSRELPATALVHPLKIRVFQQTPRFWKLAAGGGGHIMRSALTRRVSLFKLRPSLATTPYYCIWKGRDNADFGSSGLIAEARAHGDALAPLGPTARQHRPAAAGLHARTKSVRL